MSTTDYLLDVALILIVLLQIRERRLTYRQLLRPIVILGVAVGNYFTTFPTAGNDIALIAALTALGAAIGLASGQTMLLRMTSEGLMARAGWASAACWVLGMGSRFAFALWVSHGGMPTLAQFSAQHQITGSAWTVALIGMAVGEVGARTLSLLLRRRRLQGAPVAYRLA